MSFTPTSVPDGTHWFYTIMVTRAELDRVFNNTAMKKRSVVPRSFPSSLWGALHVDMCCIVLLCRTCCCSILAMSLSSLFDISHPTDFLRSALNMLTEYQQAKEDNDRIVASQRFASSRLSWTDCGCLVLVPTSIDSTSIDSTSILCHRHRKGRHGLAAGPATLVHHGARLYRIEIYMSQIKTMKTYKGNTTTMAKPPRRWRQYSNCDNHSSISVLSALAIIIKALAVLHTSCLPQACQFASLCL